MNSQNGGLLTEKEAAEELRCSASYLAKARMNGTGPEFIKLGRSVRYSRSALETYKLSQTRFSTSLRKSPHHLITPRLRNDASELR